MKHPELGITFLYEGGSTNGNRLGIIGYNQAASDGTGHHKVVSTTMHEESLLGTGYYQATRGTEQDRTLLGSRHPCKALSGTSYHRHHGEPLDIPPPSTTEELGSRNLWAPNHFLSASLNHRRNRLPKFVQGVRLGFDESDVLQC